MDDDAPDVLGPEDVKQVIVIRRDLKMRRGKEIAQGAHASSSWLANLVVEALDPVTRSATVALDEVDGPVRDGAGGDDRESVQRDLRGGHGGAAWAVPARFAVGDIDEVTGHLVIY